MKNLPVETLKAKFTRKAEYTPSTLTTGELDQVERLVKAAIAQRSLFAHVEKMVSSDGSDGTGPMGFILRDMNPVEAAPYWGSDYSAEVSLLRERDDARRYFKMCWNYMVAIAWRKGEFLEPSNPTNRTWAMASGYYG